MANIRNKNSKVKGVNFVTNFCNFCYKNNLLTIIHNKYTLTNYREYIFTETINNFTFNIIFIFNFTFIFIFIFIFIFRVRIDLVYRILVKVGNTNFCKKPLILVLKCIVIHWNTKYLKGIIEILILGFFSGFFRPFFGFFSTFFRFFFRFFSTFFRFFFGFWVSFWGNVGRQNLHEIFGKKRANPES